MEVMHSTYKTKLWSLLLCMVLLLASSGLYAQKEYTIKDGKMYLKLSKELPLPELRSFIDKCDLDELDLITFIRTNITDSLKKLGWKIEENSSKVVVLSKPLFAAEDVENPANRIMIAQKNPGNFAARFPVVSPNVRFGINRFKNKPAFTIKDSVVTFFLRGHKEAREVLLAGSFTDWQYKPIRMEKTPQGWEADVKLRAGKYWYKFVVDGHWIIDDDNLTNEHDGEGNINSVYYKPNVTFVCKGHTDAKKAFLAGSFNNWKKNQLLMTKAKDGWYMQMYLPDGTHTYKFVVDGKWYNEERKTDKLPDGNGDYNSVVRIGRTHTFKLNGYTNAKQVLLSGNFNAWKKDELYMIKTSTGWELPYTLGSGNYEYRFIVDGKWVSDPANPTMVNGENSYISIQPNYTFRLKGFSNAKTVAVAGTFNGWEPNRFKMKRQGDEWVFRLHLPPGKHLYKFVIDGKWMIDPGNKLWEQNEHHTGNSVLWIE